MFPLPKGGGPIEACVVLIPVAFAVGGFHYRKAVAPLKLELALKTQSQCSWA